MSSTASASVAPTPDPDRVGRHDLADRPVELGLAALLEQPGQVAVGEDPQQVCVLVLDQDRPRAPPRAGQPDEDLADRLVDVRPAELPPGPHHVLDPGQLPAQAAAGMVEGEVLGREVAHPADQQRQRIADGHQRRRARRGGQAQRARLLDRPQRDAQVGRPAQRAGRAAR